MRLLIAVVVVLMLVGPVRMTHSGEPKEAETKEVQKDLAKVRLYLSHKFDDFEINQDGTRSLYGLAYNKDTPIELIKVPELEEFFPQTQFFITEIDNLIFCYRKVEVIVCITTRKSGDDIRYCFSPVFTNPSQKFLNVFKNIQTETIDQRKQLATGLGNLLAKITFKSELRPLDIENEAAVSLRHHDRHWRVIHFKFDKDGKSHAPSID
ncbi:MAG: hypothetical protein COA78_28960 [Blastopirellula sp.]|nr:MAG: hypothetical protein COA78_28960 [Blastopirellula sp.]